MKTVLVTGSSRGIGRAIALEFAKNKYNIVLNYKEKDEAAMRTERDVLSLGAQCLRIKCDVRNISDIMRMHALVRKTFGITDIVVNNAGVGHMGLLQDNTENEYDYVMDTNLKGVYNVCKVFSPDMLSQSEGRIVNISSIWGQVGASMESVYSAAKAGVIGLTKALAKEFAPSGVTVNCVAPGAVDTDMLAPVSREVLGRVVDEIPMGRIGSVDDIAAFVVHFAAETSRYVTGQVINISGGFVIN